MKLKLIRRVYNEHETIGELFIDGVFECYTLEDVVRPEGEKIYGETAIGYGQYDIEISWSPRFRRMLPLLLDVPNFKGIRIHPGNYHQDTEGCILVGTSKGKNAIWRSRRAFNSLFKKLDKADSITISIE